MDSSDLRKTTAIMTKHGKILFFGGTLDELNQKGFFKPSQYILAIFIRLRLQAKKQTQNIFLLHKEWRCLETKIP